MDENLIELLTILQSETVLMATTWNHKQ